MALKPLVDVKVQELFLRWLSEPDVTKLLRQNINEIKQDKKITLHLDVQSHDKGVSSLTSPRGIRPISPPPFSPPPSKLISPRSPRRPHAKGDNGVSPATSAVSSVKKEFNLPHSPRLSGQPKFPVLNGELKPELNSNIVGTSTSNSFVSNDTNTTKFPFASTVNISINNQLSPNNTASTARQLSSNASKHPSLTVSPTAHDIQETLVKSESTHHPSPPSHIQTSSSIKTQFPSPSFVEPQPNKENKFPTEDLDELLATDHQQRQSIPELCDRIPQFYFPFGQPVILTDIDTINKSVENVFSATPDKKIHKHQMASLSMACNLPLYWKMALYTAAEGQKQGHVTFPTFSTLCHQLVETCHDNAARFMKLLAKPGCKHLTAEDFIPVIQDVVDGHPGLTFLQDAPEFHSRYINTVISRIFYVVNRSWSGRITLPELRASNFLETLQLLEEEDDINQIVEYFSYEHFYVIYCKFWELDQDHDLLIDRNDLSRHNEHAISSRMIERIFSGCVTRGNSMKEGRMTYPDFVWFLLAEEDKRHPRSIEYWFRCMDLDGDGIISMYEMEYFYDEQLQKMEALGIEKLPFEDALCQMLDLVKPKVKGRITLSDLKACKMTNIFFDTFFNLDKFLENEQRDPFANFRDLDMNISDMSDWERYAAEEYEILVAEESATEQNMQYEDDFEDGDDELLTNELLKLTDASGAVVTSIPEKQPEDIYDFNLNDIRY